MAGHASSPSLCDIPGFLAGPTAADVLDSCRTGRSLETARVVGGGTDVLRGVCGWAETLQCGLTAPYACVQEAFHRTSLLDQTRNVLQGFERVVECPSPLSAATYRVKAFQAPGEFRRGSYGKAVRGIGRPVVTMWCLGIDPTAESLRTCCQAV